MEEMRKRREENIYSARRIFIAGPRLPGESDSDQATKVNGLGMHMRHLNITGTSDDLLDVLSPETREKIRKLQTEGSMIRDSRRLTKATSEGAAAARLRRRELGSWSQARDAASGDKEEKEAPVPVDALSLTSDYSTTSSLPLGEGREGRDGPGPAPNGQQPFTSSDYSSTGASSPAFAGQRKEAAASSSSLLTTASSDSTPHIQPQPPATALANPRRPSATGLPRPWYESEEELLPNGASSPLRPRNSSESTPRSPPSPQPSTTPVAGGHPVSRSASQRSATTVNNNNAHASRAEDKPISRHECTGLLIHLN